jgi:hypothetical protein
LLKNLHQQHGILLPQHGDVHEEVPLSAQVPLYYQDYQSSKSPPNYYPPKFPHLPFHEGANHQTHALNISAETNQLVPQGLSLHQEAPCDLTHQQNHRHLHPLQHDTQPTPQFHLPKEEVTQQFIPESSKHQVPNIYSDTKLKKKVKRRVVEKVASNIDDTEDEAIEDLTVPTIPVKNYFECLSSEDFKTSNKGLPPPQ